MITNLDLQDKVSKSAVLKYRVYWQYLKNVDVDNWPKAVEATISSNVLKAGYNWMYIDSLAEVLKPATEAGTAQGTQKLAIPLSLEGVSKSSLPFFYQIDGERIILLWERCLDGQRFIGGSPCSSGLLVSGTIGALDNGLAGIKITATGGDCPEPFYFYDGPLPLVSPTVIAADATTFALSDAVQYKLSNNTAAKVLASISNVSDSDVGRVIEILGGGSTFPTAINSSATFLLSNAIAFSAVEGSRISFLVVKAGASIAFLEVHRA